MIENLAPIPHVVFVEAELVLNHFLTGWLFWFGRLAFLHILSIYGTTPNRLLASRFHVVVELCGFAQALVYHDIFQERQCLVIWKTWQLHWEGAMVYVCLHELLIESMEQLGVTKAVLVGVPRMGPGMQDDEAGTSMGNEHPGMPS